MQFLFLRDCVFGALRAGLKHTTIRKDRRDIQLGALKFRGATDISLEEIVHVISVTFTTLGGLSEDTLEADGFKDHDQALKVMKHFYGDIDFDTEVTVIDFLTECAG